MAAKKLEAFARKKAAVALKLLQQEEEESLAEGICVAQAALDFFKRGENDGDPERAQCIGDLCRNLSAALATSGRFGAALSLFRYHAGEMSDEQLRNEILNQWHAAANSPQVGDAVQVSRSALGADEHYGHLVATVVAMPQPGESKWTLQVRSPASPQGSVDGDDAENSEKNNIVVSMEAAQVTLLSLRLMEEQREYWRDLHEECPRLFGDELKTKNKVNWQRLFGAAALALQTGPRIAAEADAALPLAHSFSATLLVLLREYAELSEVKGGVVEVELLGCRDVLELSSPVGELSSLLHCAPKQIKELQVRMCGPEIKGEGYDKEVDVGDRKLRLTVRPGLYHDVFLDTSPDVVVAMNPGFGVATYAADWRPTLDLLAHRQKRTLFASTSYTPLEMMQEYHLLQRHWAEPLEVKEQWQLAQLTEALRGDTSPWTVTRTIIIQGLGTLRQGDVIYTSSGTSAPLTAPVVLEVSRQQDTLYVGPNLTPGRSRNYGKLLRWVGGRSVQSITKKILDENVPKDDLFEALRLLENEDNSGVSIESLASAARELGEDLTVDELQEILDVNHKNGYAGFLRS
jgi:hypothetical protein